MLPEEIKQVIKNTQFKESKITTPTELDAAVEPLCIFQFNITKPKEESLLHYIQVYTPPVVQTFHDQHDNELPNILMYVQIQGLGNAHHTLDIDLLPEPAVKHY